MFRATEKSRLIFGESPVQGNKLHYSPWTILLAVLLILQVVSLPGLSLYCLETFFCGKNVKHPHYNCNNGTFIRYETALTVELAFACSEVLSRAIFLGFCFKFKGCFGIFRIFKKLCKLSQMWVLALICVLCVVRFGSILYWVPDLGKIAKATIGMYIADTVEITTVVVILKYVRIRDLAEDNVNITKEKYLTFIFTCVVLSFWMQYFVYLIIVSFQLAFDVSEVDPTFEREDFKRALNLLRKSAQFVFMRQISGHLWSSLFDDDMGTVRSDENKDRMQRNEMELMTVGII